MPTFNYGAFSNNLEFLESDFQEIMKSNNKIIALTHQQLTKYREDSQNEIQKSIESEDLCKSLIENRLGTLTTLITVQVVGKDLVKSRRYIPLPSLLDEEGVIVSNQLTKALKIDGLHRDHLIEKGKRAQIGDTRNWGGTTYRKEASGWVVDKKGSSEKKEPTTDDVEKLKVGGQEFDWDSNLITISARMEKEPEKYKKPLEYLKNAGANWDKVNKITLGKYIREANEASTSGKKESEVDKLKEKQAQVHDSKIGKVYQAPSGTRYTIKERDGSEYKVKIERPDDYIGRNSKEPKVESALYSNSDLDRILKNTKEVNDSSEFKSE